MFGRESRTKAYRRVGTSKRKGSATTLRLSLFVRSASRSVLAADADAHEPALVSRDRSSILGKPWLEAATYPASQSGTIVSYCDIGSAYRVVDRIGSTLGVIPHRLGRANHRPPTGQRGAFFYARTGGGAPLPPSPNRLSKPERGAASRSSDSETANRPDGSPRRKLRISLNGETNMKRTASPASPGAKRGSCHDDLGREHLV